MRVGPDLYANALNRPSACPMDSTGKAMKGFVYAAPDGFESDQDLISCVQLSLDFVMTLPPK